MASSGGNFVLDKGYIVAAAITKFRAVKFSALDTVTPVTAATDQPIGVAQYSVSAGEITKGKRASVRLAGISEMECSAAMATAGVEVGMASDGRAKAAATGERVIGISISTTANAGERVSVLFVAAGHLKP